MEETAKNDKNDEKLNKNFSMYLTVAILYFPLTPKLQLNYGNFS